LKDIPDYPKILETKKTDELIIDELNILSASNFLKGADLEILLKRVFEDELSTDYLKSHKDEKFTQFMESIIIEINALVISKGVSPPETSWYGKKKIEYKDCQFDYNFPKIGFKNLFDSNANLQTKLPLIQSFILYILFLDEKLKRIYIKEIESRIIKQIEQDLDLLENGISHN
jgi:hypothetical protein